MRWWGWRVSWQRRVWWQRVGSGEAVTAPRCRPPPLPPPFPAAPRLRRLCHRPWALHRHCNCRQSFSNQQPPPPPSRCRSPPVDGLSAARASSAMLGRQSRCRQQRRVCCVRPHYRRRQCRPRRPQACCKMTPTTVLAPASPLCLQGGCATRRLGEWGAAFDPDGCCRRRHLAARCRCCWRQRCQQRCWSGRRFRGQRRLATTATKQQGRRTGRPCWRANVSNKLGPGVVAAVAFNSICL